MILELRIYKWVEANTLVADILAKLLPHPKVEHLSLTLGLHIAEGALMI